MSAGPNRVPAVAFELVRAENEQCRPEGQAPARRLRRRASSKRREQIRPVRGEAACRVRLALDASVAHRRAARLLLQRSQAQDSPGRCAARQTRTGARIADGCEQHSQQFRIATAIRALSRVLCGGDARLRERRLIGDLPRLPNSRSCGSSSCRSPSRAVRTTLRTPAGRQRVPSPRGSHRQASYPQNVRSRRCGSNLPTRRAFPRSHETTFTRWLVESMQESPAAVAGRYSMPACQSRCARRSRRSRSQRNRSGMSNGREDGSERRR
jgi:hypothetical protein